ncbi:hypothetical protein L2E82_37582 [Cichorium intybus]|uniref:Uncharacterized protein n=1 Tax=Cichorium intybus TaxID=13427 RepID=A0ACB9AFB3_CICIN|nr:hypothetical protein L2E82_37582 [Cichorium intybus]
MASKMMIRSCGSSIRTLINRHLRLSVTATNVQSGTPASIYNLHYYLPNSIAPQTVYFAHGFSNQAAGYSVLTEAARGRRKEKFNEEIVSEDEDDDDNEIDDLGFGSDDSEFDSDDDYKVDDYGD